MKKWLDYKKSEAHRSELRLKGLQERVIGLRYYRSRTRRTERPEVNGCEPNPISPISCLINK